MGDSDGFRSRLSETTEALDQEFGQISYISAGALFREHVAEYVSALDYLIRSLNSEVESGPEAAEQVCRRLCELSREVLFAADEDRLSLLAIELVSSLFKLAVRVISAVSADRKFVNVAVQVKVYLQNIVKRAVDNPWDSIVIA